ncbi:putative NADPH-quinone reductase [Breznakibacter xylanolyticus]|uniref:Putative NADPH-quinone reductase n=1 Tax=Breznakibacter xylanolyticus TaxID=990 RepID=A0A2W7NE05_9BACT|nr:NAD(P)H-dependent oxidoreductase [Breznakibacter xylanolyticus]PZX18160.1 putative NADPH-quinone reductase [Breznakibacter xylanolyticus]
MSKKIVIINGHPDKQSLCYTLAESYHRGALSGGAQSQMLHLCEMTFNPVLQYGYRQRTPLEPDLENARRAIGEADHLVWIYPTWWGTFPALMKGFIDRIFLPGFAFRYRDNSPLWDKLLKGKTARLIVTMDSPRWYYWLVARQPGHHAMKKGLLEFSGIRPVRITTLSPVKSSTDTTRRKWLDQIHQLGCQQC